MQIGLDVRRVEISAILQSWNAFDGHNIDHTNNPDENVLSTTSMPNRHGQKALAT